MRKYIPNFIAYLVDEHNIEVVPDSDDWNRTIDLINYAYGEPRKAFIVLGIDQNFIDWRLIEIICDKLGVKYPPKDME
jgi:hypothetical protein